MESKLLQVVKKHGYRPIVTRIKQIHIPSKTSKWLKRLDEEILTDSLKEIKAILS